MKDHIKGLTFSILFLYIILIFNKFNTIKSISQEEYDCLIPFTDFPLTTPYNAVNGIYNFCQGSSTCISDKVTKISFKKGFGTQPFIVTPEMIKCLPYLTDLIFNNIEVSPSFIYYQFTPSLISMSFYVFSGMPSGIVQKIPKYENFFLSGGIPNTNLKLSHISGIKTTFITGSNYLYIEGDEPDMLNYNVNQIALYAKNVPDLSHYKNIPILQIEYDSSVKYGMINNFSTFSARSVTSSHSNEQPFYAHLNNAIESYSVYHSFLLSKPIGYISLKNTNYSSLSLSGVGDAFNIDGNFPLIEIPDKTINFAVSGGNFTVCPPFSILGTLNNQIAITSSKITYLEKYTGNGKYYDISDNLISGTIDSSWCKTNINIKNNLMTGEIPSCYACYFNDQSTEFENLKMFDRFSNNSFTNLNKSYICTTFAPRLEVVSITPAKVRLTGTDIGFNSLNWKDQTYSINKTFVEIVTYGMDYIVTLPITNSLLNRPYYSMSFALPKVVTYTFPVANRSPNPTSVTIEAVDTLLFNGYFFSTYPGYVAQNITIDGMDCVIPNDETKSNFFSVKCTTNSSISTLQTQSVTINTGIYTKRVIINTNLLFVNDRVCPNECTSNNNGICDMSTGLCVCESGYLGLDCSQIQCDVPDCNSHGLCNTTIGKCNCNDLYYGDSCQYTQCPVPDCNSHGSCNTLSGLCVCSGLYFGDSCEYQQCSVPDCNSHGTCDTSLGLCDCNVDYKGDNCSIPIHYVSSINTSTTEGGVADFNGFFGDVHTGLSITIGGLNCSIISNSSKMISCNAPPGTGIKTSVIYQNDISVYTNYSYALTTVQCKNNCSSHGTCNTSTGICTCYPGYNDFDCSNPTNQPTTSSSTTTTTSGGENPSTPPVVIPPTNTTIDPSTGGTDIKNQEINFQIYFKTLSEVDINGNLVRSYPLVNNWKFNSSIDSNIEKAYSLSQNLQNGDCKIVSLIEEIISESGKKFTFAGTSFKLEIGSIKFSIVISNYTYLSNLNTLQLDLISSVDELQSNDNNECNTEESSTETDNVNDLSNFNYIKISKNNKILSGRFINRVMSDGRSTYLGSRVTKSPNNDSIIVSLLLPHATNFIVDPDFSVLISSDFKSSCPSNDDDNSRGWLIPVAVIVPVVGVSIIAATSYLIYRKRFVEGDLERKLKKINK